MLVVLLLIAGAAALVLGREVRGDSMHPTFDDGDRIVEEPGTDQEVARFDVVVLRAERTGPLIVKRVIALAGDRVTIRPPFTVLVQPEGSGAWFRVVARQWAGATPSACCTVDGRRGAAQVRTVPPGRFFYLGDNPDVSEDSRMFGWGRVAAVDGRVWFRTWPPGGVGGEPRLMPVASGR